MTGVPHTAAPGASFNFPSRYTSATYGQQSIIEEDDELADMLSHNMYINAQQKVYQPPSTAAVDGGINRFAHQQGHFTNGLIPGISHSNTAVSGAQLQAQQQALQVQLMQLELIRMQVRLPFLQYPFSLADLPFRHCRPSSSKSSFLLRVASRVVDHSLPLHLPVPQRSRSIVTSPF
jgi:hypothetical protein